MSTLENIAIPDLNRIPLGRRISELMAEKGEEFSIRSFALQLGMSRETLRQIVNGTRHVLPSELQMISNGFGTTVERVKQLDTIKRERELDTFFQAPKRTKPMVMRALDTATELVNVAIGASERGSSLNNLGRVYYLQQQYDEAHEIWLDALEFAKKVHEEYTDSKLLYMVTANLMLTYTIRKEYSNIEEMLSIVESAFIDVPVAMGLSHYTRMKMHEVRGNLERARKHAYLSLEHYEQTYDSKQIGIAMVNVAHFESKFGNHMESAKRLSDAISHLQQFDYYLVFAVNEYGKALIKLKDHSSASRIIAEHLDLAKAYPDVHNKLLITYSVAEGNPSFAQRVSDDSNASIEARLLACKCLIEYFSSIDDADSVLRYYKKGRMFSGKNREFFDWEAKE